MYAQSDRTLTCADCRQEFVFTASEQQFYADRQFSEPRRCASCRAAGRHRAGQRILGRRVFGRRPLRRLRSRSARNVQRHVLELRPRGAGAVPPQRREAGLLQRLLQQPAIEQPLLLAVIVD